VDVYGRERLVPDEYPRRVDPFAVHDRVRSLASALRTSRASWRWSSSATR